MRQILNLKNSSNFINKKMDNKIISSDVDQTLNFKANKVDSLIHAIGTKNHKKVRSLLEEGANPNDPNIKFKSTHNKTLLHLAVEIADKASVAILLEYGALIDNIDSFGQTALHYSVIRKQPEMCRLLLESGADSDVLDHDRKSYLSYLEEGDELNDYCITSSSTELTKDSTEEGQVILDPDPGSQLLNSVTHYKLNEVKTLLDQGVDIESKDEKGRTALEEGQVILDPDPGSQLLNSVTRRKIKEVETLLYQRVNIESKDEKGRTALQIAQKNGDVDMVIYLLDNGANSTVFDIEEDYIYSDEEGRESEEGAKANNSDRKTTQNQDDKKVSGTQDQNLMDSKITPENRNQTLLSEAAKVHYLPNAILAKNHEEGKKLENYHTTSNSTELTKDSTKEESKANTSDRKPTAESPSTNPTNPKKEEQLVTKNPTTEKRSFFEI